MHWLRHSPPALGPRRPSEEGRGEILSMPHRGGNKQRRSFLDTNPK
jgi:hypothetical protein